MRVESGPGRRNGQYLVLKCYLLFQAGLSGTEETESHSRSLQGEASDGAGTSEVGRHRGLCLRSPGRLCVDATWDGRRDR